MKRLYENNMHSEHGLRLSQSLSCKTTTTTTTALKRYSADFDFRFELAYIFKLIGAYRTIMAKRWSIIHFCYYVKWNVCDRHNTICFQFNTSLTALLTFPFSKNVCMLGSELTYRCTHSPAKFIFLDHNLCMENGVRLFQAPFWPLNTSKNKT